jgi:hypothetical protein
VRLARPLDLRHVPAVELEVAGGGERALDVLHEPDRDERVLAAPDEQRVLLQRCEARPHAVVSVRRVEVDVARRGVEREAPTRGLVGAQELVHPRGGPAVGREQAPHDRLDRHRQDAQLGAQQLDDRRPAA